MTKYSSFNRRNFIRLSAMTSAFLGLSGGQAFSSNQIEDKLEKMADMGEWISSLIID